MKKYTGLILTLLSGAAICLSQTDLLNAQNSYQNLHDIDNDNQTKLVKAESELKAAESNLVAAQKDLQLKQTNLQTAKQNYATSQKNLDQAKLTVVNVWSQVNPPTTNNK